MEREIKRITCQVEQLNATEFAVNPAGWFQKQPDVGDEAWFLAHADDGVIWGRLQDGQLVTSDTVFSEVSPPLRAITLQQARLFGEKAEVRVWREGNRFQACRLEDQSSEKCEAFDEQHILWGTQVEQRKDGFTLVADGRQGLRHAVPLTLTDSALNDGHPLRLTVRHYLTYDEYGQTRIVLSRLVALWVRSSQGGQQNES